MRIRSRLVAVAAVAALLLGAAAQRAGAQVMDQVPADALVVLKIRNLDQTNKKVAKFAKSLGLDVNEPRWADPLGALQELAHLGKGVDRSGDLALVFMDPDRAGGNPQQSLIALVPVSDYKGFVGNFKATADEGGVTKATPHEGEDVFVSEWGKFAAISPSKDLVGKKPAAALKLQGPAKNESESKDAIIYVNVKAVAPKALPQLKQGREEAMNQIAGAMEGDEKAKKFVPLAKAVVNQLMDIPQQFLEDTRSVTIGLSIGNEGISGSAIADFEPGSYLGKLAAGIKNTDAPLTAGLPDRRYFLFGGGQSDPKVTSQVLSDLMDPIIAELGKLDEAKPFMGAVDAWKKAAGSTTGQSFGWVVPQGNLGDESLMQQVQVARGDAKAIQDGTRKTLTAVTELIKLIQQQQGGAAPADVAFKIKQNAKTVGGVSLDSYETKMEFPADNPVAEEAKRVMSLIYGPAGQSGVMGAVDDKTFVAVAGGTDQLIADTIAAAKANDDKASNQPGIKMVAGQLPKSRSGVIYVNLELIVNRGISTVREFGLPVGAEIKVKPNLPPIGATFGSDGSAIRVDGFVPNELIQGLVATGIQVKKQLEEGP